MASRSLIKMIIFSPGGNLEDARGVAKRLRKRAEVRVWQDAFRKYPSKDLLNALNKILSEVDYAVFVLTPDGRSPKEQLESQKNLMFELGQAMNKLGQENVFLVCDSKADLPAYLQSIVLTFYDGSDPRALREACKAIVNKIATARFSHLSGEWKSEYLVHFMEDNPLAVERVVVVGLGTRIKIISDQNPWKDEYVAIPWFDASSGHFVGGWKSTKSEREGYFVLYLSECEKLMYGRYTGKDEHGKEIEGYWVLSKNDACEEEVAARLRMGRDRLPRIIGRPRASRARRAFRSLKEKARKINSKLLGLFMMF